MTDSDTRMAPACSERLRRQSVRFVWLASGAAACVGAVVLMAWAVELRALSELYPPLLGMKANTALCLVLSAIAVAAATAPRPVPRAVARAAASVVLCAATLTLLEWALGLDFGIDELLFVDSRVGLPSAPPGRMAPTTALSFALLAASLWFDPRQPRRRGKLARGLVASVACIAGVALVGYIYGVGPTFGIARYVTQMAVHTALALLLLAGASLALAPNAGLAALLTSSTSAGVLARRMLPAAIGLPVTLGWLRLLGQQRGLFGTELGLLLFASSNVLMFTALVVWSADSVRRRDEALQLASDELEHRVLERTAELARTNSKLELQIAERERAERELVVASALWRAILDSANLSIIATTPDGVIREFNAAAARWLGYRSDEVIGQATPVILHDAAELAVRAELLSAELGQSIAPGFEALVAKARLGEADENEWTYHRKQGPSFPVLLSVTAIRTGAGGLTGFVGVASDLTQRKHAEQQIRELRVALENAVEGIGLLDSHGLYSTVNAAYAAALGWTPEELVGKSWQLTVHPDDHARVADLLNRSVAAGKIETELVAVRRDASSFHERVVLIPAHRSDASPRGHYWFSKDISDQKQIERELIRAKEAAEAAMRARSDFLSRMSHEIRTPMNGVLGMTRLALQTALTDEQREYLGVARSSAESLLALIDDVLDFSKIDAGKLRLELVSFELRECLAQVVRGLAPRAHMKGLELVLDIGASVPAWVRGDPQRLQQILVNLVSNAIKFTDQGEVELAVTLAAQTAGSASLSFLIRDTGIGIAKDKQALVFDAFAQADEATTRKFGGTGLGLTICSELIQLMGGAIGLQSTPGAGSTFSFLLKLEIAPENTRAVPSPPALARHRVLVVDDHASSRRVICELLRAWRMNASGVPAKEALAALAEPSSAPFTLLLVDDLSASREGVDFIARLSGSGSHRRPLVLLAHATEPGVGANAAEAAEPRETQARVLKPVSPSGLLEAIQAVTLGTLGTRVSGLHAAPSERQRPRLRVLLAEDNAVNRKVAVALLSKSGHDVVSVETGRAAVTALARESFDIVLMDVQMPEMDGLEATRAIRLSEQGGARRTPIIALTAQAMQGDRARCLDAGMDGYVTKPIEPQALLDAMDRFAPPPASALGEATQPRMRAPPSPAFDSAEALRQMGGDWALLAEVIEVYRREEPGWLDMIRNAVGSADVRGVEAGAHKLKGALLNLGARDAARAALAVEEASRRGHLPRAAELDVLTSGLTELAAALAEFQRTSPRG